MSYMYDLSKTKTYIKKAFRVTSPRSILHIVMKYTSADYCGGSVNDHLKPSIVLKGSNSYQMKNHKFKLTIIIFFLNKNA